jgi:hypothetical protein
MWGKGALVKLYFHSRGMHVWSASDHAVPPPRLLSLVASLRATILAVVTTGYLVTCKVRTLGFHVALHLHFRLCGTMCKIYPYRH